MKTNVFKIILLLIIAIVVLHISNISSRYIQKQFVSQVNEVAVDQFEKNDSYAELQLITEAKNVKLIIIELLNFFVCFGISFLIGREVINIRRKMNEENCNDSVGSSSNN